MDNSYIIHPSPFDPTTTLTKILQIQHPSHQGRCLANNKSNGQRCGNAPAADHMEAAKATMRSICHKLAHAEHATEELLDLAGLMICKTKRINHQQQVPKMVVEWVEKLRTNCYAWHETPAQDELERMWRVKQIRSNKERATCADQMESDDDDETMSVQESVYTEIGSDNNDDETMSTDETIQASEISSDDETICASEGTGSTEKMNLKEEVAEMRRIEETLSQATPSTRISARSAEVSNGKNWFWYMLGARVY